MSSLPIKDSTDAVRNVDVFQRTDGGAVVEIQAVAIVNPTTGDALLPGSGGKLPVEVSALPLPAGAATQATLEALLTAAQAAQAAAEALNAKATAINTGAVAGTVGLDAPTLAALESITAATGGLTNTELRATAVTVAGTFWQATQPVSGTFWQATQPVSAAALPLPAGAATETTLSALNSKLPTLSAGRVPVELPAGGAGLTNTELRAAAVPVSGTFWQATQPVSFTWAGLTDAQLRASAVPVSVASLPLPAGAATETTLAALNGKLPALNSGRVPVELPAGGGGLTDAELRATAVPVSVASLPLPTGAATEATLAALASVVKLEDSQGADGDSGMVMLAQRRDSDTAATGTDGDYATLKMDETGRLKVASQPASYAVTTGNVTSATSAIPVNTERFSNLMAHCAGTFGGANCTFEGSLNSTNGTDGNWFAVQAIRSNANTIETVTGVLAAAPAYAWELSVNALKWFRIRATAWTSGTQVWTLVPGTYATEPIPGAQVSATQPVSGSVTATLAAAATRVGFIAGAGIWYDDSAVALAGAATFTGTSRDATVTATATAFANAATYAMEVRLAAESDQSGTLWLEVSRDNTNWRRAKSVPTAAVTGGGQYAEVVHRPSWRYWRVGYTNGATLQTRFTINSLSIAA